MTPYLMKVQDTEHTEEQFCCLLLAERVHSGYDGKDLTSKWTNLEGKFVKFEGLENVWCHNKYVGGG